MNHETPIDCFSRSEEETEAIACRLAQQLGPGSLILLHGAIGTGKTVFARGIIHGLGHSDPYITSPTFTLVNTYTQGRLPVYHFDLYRLESVDELFLSGAGDYLDAGGVCLVEWPNLLIERGIKDYLEIMLTADMNEPMAHRLIRLLPHGPSSRQSLNHFAWPVQ
ncbi:MAG: tRNA (adenosine(37)-N6)-threonylcarbamoyltransferase complex ATPase subunit type 1 TsaE [Magnetococcales bacterium]|nr:tRNA (adenosine(37)-N6)-threonylcarbamoyltransferase complex ATPase subunit type 1 TsaE [Magnetococcales bacterium]MBF0149637.1 tRNA (adenosine(37)-N6)-threonylcarbamoyltransferase complex ATPase subunit type 1 TsaE [Magnetococcales bacterium]MBF0172483.1 tRNA (adenosine(37)-N6)-threonylcarbamoyltransferase complex ATPase subunit type 1 TsaE [Magnetococcales bacterium]MBF0347569.1 tRNA (adenosine(37)-N6)-threonylcarbamoyltransferase complex ATPase subunit type 1 TsaE [Magnetococcales bacteriu